MMIYAFSKPKWGRFMKWLSKIGFCFLFYMLIIESSSIAVFAQANPVGAFEFVSRIDASKDDALEMVLDDKLLFVANKVAGLSIVDISDIYNPKVVSRTRSVGQNYGIAKKGNFVYMADNLAGLLVYDVTNIKKPVIVAELAVKGEAWDVKVKDNYAYIAAGLAGLVVVDITEPKAPKVITTLRYDKDWDYARKVFISDKGLLFVADRKSGIHAINIDNPAAPRELRRFVTQFAVGIEVYDDFAYVADGPSGVVIVDVSNPEKMRQVADFKLPGHTNNVAKVGPYVYVSIDDAGIRAIDVSNPNKPKFDARYDTPGQAFSLVKYDIFMVVADLSSILFLTHNKPPVIFPTPDKTVAENQKLEFKVRGMDPDGNPVGFSANFIPEGAAYNEKDSLFSWTPTFEQSGKYEGIVFTVTEKTQTKLFSRDTITITVTNTNRAPSLPLTGNYTVDENKEIVFAINKPSDADVEDDGKLKVSAASLPQGSSFDEATLSFKWNPNYEQSGSYTINFIAKDDGGLTDTKQSVITVNHINRPPIFADLAAGFTTDENKPFIFNIQASDPDKEDAGKLDYAGFNLPAGAVFDKSAQAFNWTPTYDQSGKYEGIYFIVKDVDGLSDTVNTTVTVNHVNRPPVIASITAQQIDEVKVLSFKISASDPDVEDEGKVTIKASNLPEGAAFQEASNTFAWTPTYEQSGDFTTLFTATDGAGATDELSVPVKVMNINRPPVIAAIAAQAVDENKEFILVLPEATDPDKEDIGKLTYTIENLPQGATFDATARTVKWTPTYDQSGVYDGIKVTVKDALGLTAAASFKITVNHVNRAPALDAIADQLADETKPLQFRVKGSDPDKEDAGKLVITAENVPTGATAQVYEGVMVFAWTPSFDQSGEYNVTFKITDPDKSVDTKTVKIAVTNINRLPKLAAIQPAAGEENKPASIVIPEAEDLDKEDTGKLVYTAEGLPEGATFDAASRTINWTPTYEQSGSYSVKVTVTDILGGKDTKNMDIKIAHVNRPPVMNDIAAQSVDEGQKLTFNVEVSDPDKEDQNKLTVTAEGTPQGAVFNTQGRSFTWTPTFDQAGSYTVTFKVADPAGLSASKSATITVKNVNRKPALGALANQKGTENQAMSFTATATDPDKEDAGKVKLTADGLPDGASFSDGKFTWTPNYDQAGDYSITIKARDGEGLEESKTITVSVSNVNRAPKLSSLSNQDGAEGSAISFNASASDEDKNDKLVFSMTGAPAGATMSSDGSFSWTPGAGQAGTYTVTVKVTDGSLSDTKTCTITVAKPQ
ncbi:tandem-95 repeat protein [bacterium]|nr:tandem-95 repeat protein [bacterium]